METPSVHHTPTPSVHPGIKGFMTTDTAGMPNWVWLLVIAAGVGAAILIPKFFNKSSSSSTSPTTTGTDSTSGIGLAVDPTTGLPYAVEGLVPSGGVGGTDTGQMGQTGPTGAQGPPGVSGNSTPVPGQVFRGPSGVYHYEATGTETLAQIASKLGFKSWNDLYAIPDNQKEFGKLNSAQAAAYKPGYAMDITIPPWPGGTTQVRAGG